ncbi:hypothetical protein H2203_002112 [Taxawa tesnikishii (nom. ined.)]|nr:hypothetical protein H2203_002112 [Dothideales sp. JES 119]
MLCAISGEAPQVPVASRKSGNVFEKRLIESYIAEHGTDPVNGEDLAVDDLVELKQSRVVRPRPPTLTSIPALLASFQNEWDALILETYQLKQQLAETRQELSTALYYNDSAEKVIARLQKERDEARDALSKITISSPNGVNGDGDAMQTLCYPQETPYSGWLGDGGNDTIFGRATNDADILPRQPLSGSGQHRRPCSFGGANGAAGVWSISQNSLVETLDGGNGTVTDGVWAGTRAVLALSTGAVKVFEDGAEVASFNQHAGSVRAVALHPCGDIIASVGADKSYILYDLQSLKPITQVPTDSQLTTAAFHPDGHLFAAGTSTGMIKLFDVKTSENAANFTSASSSGAPVASLSFSENGTWLASALAQSTSVSIWDLRKMAELKVLDIGTGISSVEWDYTGQFLAVCGQGCVAVQQYEKASKSWLEPFRKAISAVDVKWGANAKSLLALTGDGAVSVLGSA